MQFKSGFITIVGRPNSGKSTLMNQILKHKIAITSDKPQTTRNKIQGVYTTDQFQMIFIDTPGIHKPKDELGKMMNEMALKSLNSVDIVLYIVSGNEIMSSGEAFIIERLKNVQQPVYLIINKVDQMKKEEIYKTIETYKDKFPFKEIIPISALTGENVPRLLQLIETELPVGPQYYSSDMITDHPEQFVIAEFIREKVLYKTREEIPHSVAVVIDQLKKRENGHIIDCYATIIVDRDSQKPIIIGKNGQMLKDIGTLARIDIENLLGSKVYLELWVKVVKDWRNRKNLLHEYGYFENE